MNDQTESCSHRNPRFANRLRAICNAIPELVLVCVCYLYTSTTPNVSCSAMHSDAM